MGSALCFPVESYLFFVSAVCTLVDEAIKPHLAKGETISHWARRNARGYKSLVRAKSRLVFVYGDDIICRREDSSAIIASLERFGLLFNANKCCVAGSFRESCGCDAFRGVDVTPARLRATWSSSVKYDPETLYSYAAFSNAMQARGHIGVANFIRSRIGSVYGKIPYTNHIEISTSFDDVKRLEQNPLGVSGVCFYTNDGPAEAYNTYVPYRWNNKYHRREYRTWRATARKAVTPHDGYPEMLRRTLLPKGMVNGKDAVGSYTVRHRSRLQMTWNFVG